MLSSLFPRVLTSNKRLNSAAFSACRIPSCFSIHKSVRYSSSSSLPLKTELPTEPIVFKDGILLYEGSINPLVKKMKYIASGVFVCFSIVYPICAVGFNVGTATFGLGSRLLISGIGICASSLLMGFLHKFTKGYAITIRTRGSDPNIWVVQTHSLLGYVKEVELNTKNIKPCKDTKYYQFECDGVKYFVLYEVFLNKELWASLGLEVPPV